MQIDVSGAGGQGGGCSGRFVTAGVSPRMTRMNANRKVRSQTARYTAAGSKSKSVNENARVGGLFDND